MSQAEQTARAASVSRPILAFGKWALLLAALLTALAVFPEEMVEAVRFALDNLLSIAPIILLGVTLTAAITASGSMAFIASAFAGHQLRVIVIVSLVGAVTPVCGLSVLPLVAGLLAGGVPLAPIMAFWLSSPVTDPGMLAITAATLGLPFAVAKTLSAFMIGVLGGLTTLWLTRLGWFRDPARPGALVRSCASACASGEGGVTWRFWRDPERFNVFGRTATTTLRLMLLWLSLAFLAEYFLRQYLPADAVAGLVGADSPWAVPLSAAVGAPIYLDGYAALPLVRGLIESGMRPDAAMAFLVAGGTVSAWAVIPVLALVRLPVFLFYVAAAVVGAMLAGWLSTPFLS